jgi:hypothetical protein
VVTDWTDAVLLLPQVKQLSSSFKIIRHFHA